MEQRIQIVEKFLHVKFPKDYKEFLKEVGVYCGEYYDVYGYDEKIQDIQDYPCVIGATKRYQKCLELLPHEIVIYFDEYLNVVVALNCEDEGIYNVFFEERQKIAQNFQEWFDSLRNLEIRAIQEEKEENEKHCHLVR